MATLTTSGRIAYQQAMKGATFHLAWGNGDESWGNSPPSESISATALLTEVGRREALNVAYVLPDPGGLIALPEGDYTESIEPTRYLLVDFHFDFGDADDQTIREVAVFVDTVADGAVPPGQMYLTPAEVADPGTLLMVEHLAPAIIRSPVTRQRFQYILTI